MTEYRNWREAKAPKLVIDAAEKEMEAWPLTAALAWPTEARPAPMPFRWGDYDWQEGSTPVPGTYWVTRAGGDYSVGAVIKVVLRRRIEGDPGWNHWIFLASNGEPTRQITRGPLYASEEDARLALLWDECEKCAWRLMRAREGL